MYWRLTQNPNFYNLTDVSGNGINDYLSQLVENSIEELENTKCISREENDDLTPINLGIISSFYYVNT